MKERLQPQPPREDFSQITRALMLAFRYAKTFVLVA
jgi:hypothetical protein